MRVELGVCPNCSEAVLRIGLGDRKVALAVLAALGVREVSRRCFSWDGRTEYLLTDGSVPVPQRVQFGRQVYLCPSPSQWWRQRRQRPSCWIETGDNPHRCLYPLMKKLEGALNLAWEGHSELYYEWLGGAAPPLEPPHPKLPRSGWDLALVVPWRRRELAEAAWRCFLDVCRKQADPLRPFLGWSVVGGGESGSAVVVRGLSAVPYSLFPCLDGLVGEAELVFRDPARIVFRPGADDFLCWRRARAALSAR